MKKKLIKLMFILLYTAVLIDITIRVLYKKTDGEYLKEHGLTCMYRSYFNTMLLWQETLLRGKNLTDFFNSTESIAVYGMGDIGKLICRHLKSDSKNLKYCIDKSMTAFNPDFGVKTYLRDEKLPPVDTVIISLEYVSDETKAILKGQEIKRIVSIDEVLESLLEEER